MIFEACRDPAISPSLGNEMLTVVARALASFRPGIATGADRLDVSTKSVRVVDQANRENDSLTQLRQHLRAGHPQ